MNIIYRDFDRSCHTCLMTPHEIIIEKLLVEAQLLHTEFMSLSIIKLVKGVRPGTKDRQ